MKILATMASVCVVTMAGAVAYAADCDQRDAPPQHQGMGPVFSGTSGVFLPAAGPNFKQWLCYFPSTERILSVEPTLRNAKGNLATYAVFDVTYNYERAGFTEVKISWTTTAKKPIPVDQLTLNFAVTFETPQPPAQP